MALYSYTARDSAGKRMTGTQEAPSPDILIDRLSARGYIVTKVEPAIAGSPSKFLGGFSLGGKIKDEQFIFFNMQLSNMLEAGLPILPSLENILYQVKNKKFNSVLRSVANSIEGGKPFSESVAEFPKVFNELFATLVMVGESSGTLEIILSRYVKLLEDQFELKKKVKSAMTYPIIMIVVSILVVSLMVTVVVPNFVKIFLKSGVPLPWPTRFLYELSQFAKKYYILIFVICILLFAMVSFLKKTKRGSRYIDILKLKLPPFGSLNRKVIMSRWARTLGTLIAGGVPILQSLTISKKVAQNKLIEESLDRACSAVERGGRLGDTFREDKEFPVEVVQMISVGEESGSLDKMLLKIADFYDKLIGYQVKKVSDMIEPAFLFIVGGIVGFIMLSLMLPIFDMLKALQVGG